MEAHGFKIMLLVHDSASPLRATIEGVSSLSSSLVLHTISLDKDAAVVPVLYFAILHSELQQDW